MPRTPLSPCDCKHNVRLFVQESRSGPPSFREYISVCRDCGEFRVSVMKEGVSVVTTFTLPTWELVVAASQYARLLDQED